MTDIDCRLAGRIWAIVSKFGNCQLCFSSQTHFELRRSFWYPEAGSGRRELGVNLSVVMRLAAVADLRQWGPRLPGGVPL
jgi:hypothetical protein